MKLLIRKAFEQAVSHIANSWVHWRWKVKWRPRPRQKNSHWLHPIIWILACLPIAAAAGAYLLVQKEIWLVKDLANGPQHVSTVILDRNNRVLYQVYTDENRTVVPLTDISPYLQQATIAIEDKSFYSHHGFSIKGISRAALANWRGDSVQGGSTLTQQLVKMTLLSPEKTFTRKLKELILAIIVDAIYTKDQILTMYLNQIPYGGSTYGAAQASERYFGKPTSELSIAEAALLAGLPAAPTAFSPFGSYPELAESRQKEVLRRMAEDGHITPEQAELASKEKLNFKEDTTNINAPHFVMYIRSLLAERYGEDAIARNGLVVRTTLDLDLQQLSQQAVATEVAKLKNLNVNNGAALVTNPQTGEILSMVGSVNYFDFAHDGQVNVTLRPRQPGSSIKPLTYATAMQLGQISPTSLILDAPISYQSPGSPIYSPVNYDGQFHGQVSVRESLANSYNIPAVKTLANVGVDEFINQATAMGISTWEDRKRFGLSLTLGGGEVIMTDLAKAYSSFANGGYTVELNPFLEISTYKGEQLYRNTCALDNLGCLRNQVLDSRVAYQISDILSDNDARTSAFGSQSVLHIPNQQVAVKTGTTNNLRDNWTVGYTSNRLVATWVGNNNNTSMSYVVSGITGASPIWNKIIRSQLDADNPHIFPIPAGLNQVRVCRRLGKTVCGWQNCASPTYEYFIGLPPSNWCAQTTTAKPTDKN